jgi:TM2 domain-containing membrane protein YozV
LDNNNFSKRDLTLEELACLESEMLKRRKNKDIAWGLWAGLSFFGAHRFYTGDFQYASIMLLTTFLPLFFLIISAFIGASKIILIPAILLLIGSVIWSWIDAFFLSQRIIDLNDGIEQAILKDIRQQRRAV